MKTFSKIITYVLIVAVLLGVFGLLYAFIGNGQRNFYVQYGNTSVPPRADNYVFEKNAYTMVYCGTLTGKKVEYSVAITFNTHNISDTSYSLDGKSMNYKYDLYGYDCTELFNVTVADDYFTFYVPQDLTIAEILQTKYPENKISDVTEIDLWAKDYFVLTVTDKVEHRSTAISFH